MTNNKLLSFFRSHVPRAVLHRVKNTIEREHQKTVLVVDDIPENSLLVKALLAMKPYRVLSVASGKEALRMIEKEKPDIVLLDIMMPEMDGYQVLSAIRNNPSTAHLPVIMLTAYVDKEQHEKSLRLGADGYIAKPIVMSELHEILERLLS